MGFTICQTVAAIIAGSEAMMGDSAAMFVDALTYLFNWIAERRKKQFDQGDIEGVASDSEDPERALRIRTRAKRKMTLQLEIVPPLISVSTLVAVTAFVLRKAIRIIVLDMHRDRSKQANPNVELMFLFSTVNLFLDVFNVFCFAKANHALGYKTTNKPTEGDSPLALAQNRNYVTLGGDDLGEEFAESNGQDELERNSLDSKHDTIQDNHDQEAPMTPNRKMQNEVGLSNGTHQTVHSSPEVATSCVPDEDEENEPHTANLNMCSAYTVRLSVCQSIAFVDAVQCHALVSLKRYSIMPSYSFFVVK